MKYTFVLKFALKTAVLLVILVLILNAFYDSTRDKPRKSNLSSKSNFANLPPSYRNQRLEPMSYDFDYKETPVHSKTNKMHSSTTNYVNKGNTRIIQNFSKQINPVIVSAPSSDNPSDNKLTKKQEKSLVNESEAVATVNPKYDNEIREEDYVDFEQASLRKTITDRYFELRNLLSVNNTLKNLKALKKQLKMNPRPTWKTKALTTDKDTLEKSLGNLWRPLKPPELEQDDRLVSQLIWQMEASNNSLLRNNKVKKILIYDTFKWWGKKSWTGQKKQLDYCPGGFNQCVLMESAESFNSVDAIVTVRDMFHLRMLPVPSNVLKFYFILESPYASTATIFTENELLASYWRGSDIVTPYAKWVYYNPAIRGIKQKINYAHGKTKTAAVFMSNCQGMNNRLDYVRSLQKYIHVDIYGDCGTEQCSRSDAQSCFQKLSKEYRFYLAFENSNCRDYITEKFFENALKNNVVPIVLGAHPEDYRTSSPYNSYIHVEDFDSPQELAVYLKFLEENDAEYNKYFEWKGTGEFISSDFFCRVCAMVHYADIYPPPKRESIFSWHDRDSGMCLHPGRWYWTKPNHPDDGSLSVIL